MVLVIDWIKSIEGRFAEHRGIIKTTVTVEPGNRRHFLISQCKVKQRQVFLQPLLARGLGNDGCTALNSPTQDNLSR